MAAAGTPQGGRLPEADREAVVARRVQQVARTRITPGGEVLVVTLPFRYQFPDERGGRTPQQAGGGQPRFKLAETALAVEGAAGVFWPLRRALAINAAVESHFGATPREVVSRLVQLAREFAGRQPLRDDLTLLVVRAGPTRS